MPTLFVIRGNDQGARFELDDSPIALGRDPQSDLALNDSEVSRQHAVVRREGDGFRVIDLDSSNGTFVNDQRVQEHRLRTGDRLQLGRTLMLFTDAEHEVTLKTSDPFDIVAATESADHSHIIKSISHEEGSRIFDLEVDSSASPWLRRARSNLQVMYETAVAVSRTLDIDALLARILELIFDWVDADRGGILLLNPDTGRLEPKTRRDRHAKPPHEPAGRVPERPDETLNSPGHAPKESAALAISQTILDYVLDRGEGVLTSDAKHDARWDPTASIVQSDIREAICVPMRGRYDVVGVIYIDTLTAAEAVIRGKTRPKFNEEHLKLMIAIAHQAALAVEDTRYYSAMVQAERLAAIGQTIATLSHHTKNILQGVRGGSYLIEMGLSEHDEELIRKGWNIVEKNQGKISNLVLDMLTFSKEREPDMGPANLNDVVTDVHELMQTRAAELDVTLHLLLDPRMPTLTFDEDGIHRAVLNVVTNAIDACGENIAGGDNQAGNVHIHTDYAADDQLARVVVRDDGPGIPAHEIDDMFTIFVSKKGSRGTGLGLPVSNKILSEHGGEIRVDSTVGTGSTFTLEIPATTVQDPSAQEPRTIRDTTPLPPQLPGM